MEENINDHAGSGDEVRTPEEEPIEDKIGSLISSTSLVKPVPPDLGERRENGTLEEVEEMSEPVPPELPAEETEQQSVSSAEGMSLQQFIAIPFFRKLVISRLLRKLR